MADLAALERILGIKFADMSRLEQALVHSSYANEHPDSASGANERLEFLGDAVLGLVMAERLYRDFPHSDEGRMTRLRVALVCRDALAKVARRIGLGDYLYLGRGEAAGGGRDKPANLAGALEAVIAAVFLDRGLVATRGFILRLFREEFEGVVGGEGDTDYKSQLQQFVQARGQPVPSYHLVETSGPDHWRRFTVEVDASGVQGRGSGRSKKAAETEAARIVLEQLESGFTP